MRRFAHAFALTLLVVSPAVGRVWTDTTGEQSAEAEFVSLDGDVVKFQLPDGELRRCDRGQLSPEDQIVVAALAACQTPAAPPAPETIVSAPKTDTTNPAQVLTSATANAQACPAPATYECTVMVPEMVTEMRTVRDCEWRNEQRQSTYTSCRMVPETHQITYEYTVPTYETRQREFVCSVFKPVVSTHEREYTVMVPHREKRQGTRRECQMVPVEMTRTVCEDHGSWQQTVRQSGCGCCGSCEQVCNAWVPKLERREVKYTVMRPEAHDVPYEYDVMVCLPEKRTETVQTCNYVAEPQKRSVPYTVCVPVTKTGTRDITRYRMVQEQKNCTYTVRVPYPVERQVPVQVCRMVAKKVTLQAPACGASTWCNSRCW